MKKTATQLGLSFIKFHNQSLQDYATDHRLKKENELFDRVLLDVPCSGTGVMAKKTDLRWNKTEQDLTDLTSLQVSPCPMI